jgi:predicted metal-dependent peptidase
MAPPTGTNAQEERIKWNNKLAGALRAGKEAGNLPGGLQAYIEKALQPKISWQDVLRNFCITGGKNDRTWAKPHRRYMSSGIYLPGITGVSAGVIAVLVDASYSITDNVLSQFGAEIASIHEETRPEMIHVVYFDTKVSNHEEFGPDDEFSLAVK